MQLDGRELVITTSIGISVYPEDGEDARVLIKNASNPMYRAKDEGRNSFQMYQTAMNARSLEHLALEAALHYQPVVDIASGKVVVAKGVETQAQLAILTASGCDMAQGFLFSRPLPADAFPTWDRANDRSN